MDTLNSLLYQIHIPPGKHIFEVLYRVDGPNIVGAYGH